MAVLITRQPVIPSAPPPPHSSLLRPQLPWHPALLACTAEVGVATRPPPHLRPLVLAAASGISLWTFSQPCERGPALTHILRYT